MNSWPGKDPVFSGSEPLVVPYLRFQCQAPGIPRCIGPVPVLEEFTASRGETPRVLMRQWAVLFIHDCISHSFMICICLMTIYHVPDDDTQGLRGCGSPEGGASASLGLIRDGLSEKGFKDLPCTSDLTSHPKYISFLAVPGTCQICSLPQSLCTC